jgi:hypothetical protein
VQYTLLHHGFNYMCGNKCNKLFAECGKLITAICQTCCNSILTFLKFLL